MTLLWCGLSLTFENRLKKDKFQELKLGLKKEVVFIIIDSMIMIV